MNLIDSVVQCGMPFLVRDPATGEVTALNNVADCAERIVLCPLRYVLTDELAHLCADLAYAEGASTAACADTRMSPPPASRPRLPAAARRADFLAGAASSGQRPRRQRADPHVEYR